MSELSSPADELSGLTLEGGWVVGRKVARPPGATGGNFSVCYHVANDESGGPYDGETGFLKALDYSPAAISDDPPRLLQMLTEAFNFERDLVDQCRTNRMRHVVEGVTSGEVRVEGHGPILERVNYLIFEAADHDIRRALELSADLDLAWTFRSLHNVANGLRQLHAAGVSHQDLKPSNVLEFGDQRKIGDLGRAYKVGVEAPHDKYNIPGDPSYAPPEQIYGFFHPDQGVRRRSSDLFQLGNLMYFLLAKSNITPQLLANLDQSLWPASFGSNYEQALPMVRRAFGVVSEQMEQQVPIEYRQRVAETFRELADPDIALRGVPGAPSLTPQRFQLDRYVSRFDNLARSAQISAKRSLQ